jgi:hypothetical protein
MLRAAGAVSKDTKTALPEPGDTWKVILNSAKPEILRSLIPKMR